jgi:hypothetical protein
MKEVLLESVLVCPVCGFAKRETMPTDACQFFYECSNCKTLLRPKPGDCCVFCSYGSPMQDENLACWTCRQGLFMQSSPTLTTAPQRAAAPSGWRRVEELAFLDADGGEQTQRFPDRVSHSAPHARRG